MKVQFPDLAAFALETIRMGQPENTKNMHTLAQHYMAHDQPEKASEVYRAIVKVDPRDITAVKGEKDAAARSSILRQGWDQEGDFRKAMKNAEEAGILELLNKQGRTREQTESLLARVVDEYNQDQTNINTVKAMAQLYDELDQSDNALMFYEYALTLNPGDVALQRRTELIRDKVRDIHIAQMEADIEANPGAPDIEEKRAQLAQIRMERAQTAINEARARVERNPTDKQVRFDLGQAYFNAGMHTEAIPELQQAKSNPNIRIKAMLLLGRCFERKNMNDLAQSALAEASKELAIMDNTKKEILYELALVSSSSNPARKSTTPTTATATWPAASSPPTSEALDLPCAAAGPPVAARTARVPPKGRAPGLRHSGKAPRQAACPLAPARRAWHPPRHPCNRPPPPARPCSGWPFTPWPRAWR